MGAVFFDVDGTLFDTRADLAEAVNHTRRDLALPELSQAAVVSHVGQGADYLLAHAIPEVAASSAETVKALFRRHYAEHCCERVVPYPGVPETLEALVRRGWKVGVNTNKPAFAVRRILARFGLDGLFGPAVVAGGDGVALKPSADPLFACAARMGCTVAASDWMVGDSWTDMRCAENAGVRGAFCAFGFGSLKEAPCAVRLARFADLLEAVDAN